MAQQDRKRRWVDRATSAGEEAEDRQKRLISHRPRSSPPAPKTSGARLRAARTSSLFPRTSLHRFSGRQRSLPKAERIRGALLGLLVGDALGVPYEFHAAHELPPLDQIDMQPPPGFRRAHGVPPGTWSDDGAQALCLTASLVEKRRFDLEDFVARLLRWLDEGYMAVEGRVFDVGAQTLSALRAIRLGVPPLEAASRSAQSNGSLMRVLPLALFEQGSDSRLVENAHLQSRITHPHPRVRTCCALYCLWARYELEGRDDAWDGAFRRVLQIYKNTAPFRWEPELADELLAHFGPSAATSPTGSATAVDSLHSAVVACEGKSYERIVRRAVAFGRSAGTTACLAGGIAGLRHGPKGIPERWRRQLRGRDSLDPLLKEVAGFTRPRLSGAPPP